MHFEDYPPLTNTLKTELLHKNFTVGPYSANIEEIAVYLEDYDIAMKAVKLPEERFKSIIDKYETAYRHRYNDNIKKNFKLIDNPAYTGTLMMFNTGTYMFELLREAVQKEIYPPKDTEAIIRRNDAIRDISITNKKLGITEKISTDIMTFKSFINQHKKGARKSLEEYGMTKNYNQYLSDDRFRKLYTDLAKSASRIYDDLHSKDLNKDEKLLYLYDLQLKQAKDLSDRIQTNSENYNLLEKAMENIVYLEQKHKEYHQKQRH